ncbi:hypothetical protein [Streptomyces sp. 8N706]|uniref:hypothetical protein n=1 Tax=Streptomyces sp. 8N706 TaxID=3457416 RepID=UPI003FCF4B64
MTGRRAKPTPGVPATQPVLLDWRASLHFRWDELCVLCTNLTPPCSHAAGPVHKTCAELWNAVNPGEVSFVSEAHKRDDSQA